MTSSLPLHPDFTPALAARILQGAGREWWGEGSPSADENRTFTAVTSDSRTLVPGSLFIPLQGDRFDGHDFIPEALAAGASAILCRSDYPKPAAIPGGARVFRVPDTLQAFTALAAAYRRLFRIPVLAVAGSVGKTTTKEMLAALLRGRFGKVLKTAGSQNGFVGIPITLFSLSPLHGAAVIEVGIDEPRTMEGHCETVSPDAALVTCIAPEHLEKLGNLENVAEEEFLALETTIKKGGFALLNADDPFLRARAARLPAERVLSFSMTGFAETGSHNPRRAEGGESAGPRPSKSLPLSEVRGRHLPEARSLQLETGIHPPFTLDLPLPGAHNAMNLLAAASMALALGLTPEELRQGLATFQGAPGRTEIRRSPEGILFLCDHYNANPASMEAALQLLPGLREGADGRKEKEGRLFACLGDMLELGEDAAEYHRRLAPALQQAGLEHLFLFGPLMAGLAAELGSPSPGGQPRMQVDHYTDHALLARDLGREIRPGDVVLLKGSRGMRMEKIWEALYPGAPKAGK